MPPLACMPPLAEVLPPTPPPATDIPPFPPAVPSEPAAPPLGVPLEGEGLLLEQAESKRAIQQVIGWIRMRFSTGSKDGSFKTRFAKTRFV